MKVSARAVIHLVLTTHLWACADRGAPREADPDALLLAAADHSRSHAQLHGVEALDTVEVPRPSNLEDFVWNEEAAIVLGKALFWDMQVGSDGQACASCHFRAGADLRVKNQLSPGLNRVLDPDRTPDPDLTFGDANGLTGSGGIAGSNYELVEEDFPFHRLEDPEERDSCVDGEDNDGDGLEDEDDPDCFDMNDVASSQGTFDGDFLSLNSRGSELDFDICGAPDGAIFNVGGIPVRKVEPRHTPTVINAVFNHRNFWDGRANNIFNGLNPLGERGLLPTTDNPNPGTLVFRHGRVEKEQVRIDNASLASQAVGPPLSDFEMSCAGRTFADIGQKLLKRHPLEFQRIKHDDSVLAAFRQSDGTGLRGQYRDLVRMAFRPEFWAGRGTFDANGEPASSGYSQMEVNFSLFFGLAVQLYEATLVADETPFDEFLRGDNDALDEVEQFGLEIFLDDGKCVNCHSGPELTGASVRLRANEPDGNEEAVERMVMGDDGVALYDGGFYNIGVRPTLEDLGVGAELAGFPLAFSRQLSTGNIIDDFDVDPDELEVPGEIVLGERVAVDGAFKVPGLRNTELTGPYFHNGGSATLAQVVEFYDRGGDRIDLGSSSPECDTTGFAEECSNLDPDIQRLGLDDIVREIDGVEVTAEEALVRFLLTLTDERVRDQEEPFDHPQILVPNGHEGDQLVVTDDGTGKAVDEILDVPAVGEDGDGELGTFLDLDPLED